MTTCSVCKENLPNDQLLVSKKDKQTTVCLSCIVDIARNTNPWCYDHQFEFQPDKN